MPFRYGCADVVARKTVCLPIPTFSIEVSAEFPGTEARCAEAVSKTWLGGRRKPAAPRQGPSAFHCDPARFSKAANPKSASWARGANDGGFLDPPALVFATAAARRRHREILRVPLDKKRELTVFYAD